MRFIRKGGRIIPIRDSEDSQKVRKAYKGLMVAERGDDLHARVGHVADRLSARTRPPTLGQVNVLKRANNLVGHHQARANLLMRDVGNKNLLKALALSVTRRWGK